jgi:phosphatidylserine decarboxylase
MVITGVYYALGLLAVGTLAFLASGSHLALAPFVILALFCLNFFRDPDRVTPPGRHAVSPADGKVVAVIQENGKTRVSIFLNVFDVHVNRTPIGGVIESVVYRKGLFLVASKHEATAQNEQNVVTVLGDDGVRLVYSQIVGLIARRIVFYKKVGDRVAMGERIGLMKFGSRMDVFFGPEWQVTVTQGQRVRAAETIIAKLV